MRAVASLVAAMAAAAACDAGPPSGDLDAPPLWSVTRVHELGSVDDPDQALTRVGTVVLGADDELLIEQTEDAAIRVHGPDATFRGTIGRRGEGPGEIGGLQTFGIREDRIWVLDQGNGRLTWFGLDGSFLSDEPWSPAPTYEGKASFNYAFPLRMRLRPDGTVLAIPGVLQILQEGETAPPVRPPIVTIEADATIRDTVVLQSLESADPVSDELYDRFPTDPEYGLTADGEGVVFVERPVARTEDVGSFRLVRVNVSGDTVIDRSYRYAPIATPASLDQRIFEGLSETLQRRDRGRIHVPPRYPPVTDLVVAQDGTIWLAREDGPGPTRTWWALDPGSGDVLGSIELPRDHTIVAGRGATVVTRHEDALEVPYVTRWRIERS